MIISVDDSNKVLWYNTTLNEQEAQQYCNDNTYWLENTVIPQSEETEDRQAILYFSKEEGFYYQYVEQSEIQENEIVTRLEELLKTSEGSLKVKSIQSGYAAVGGEGKRYITISPVDISKCLFITDTSGNMWSSNYGTTIQIPHLINETQIEQSPSYNSLCAAFTWNIIEFY